MKPFVLTFTTLLCLVSWHTTVTAEPEVQFERSYVSHDWGQVHVLASEPAELTQATPLVCFAPNPYSGNYYRLFMEELGSDRIMIAPDYPGIGQSDDYPGSLDMSLLASIMADTLISMGWGAAGRGPVDLCGYHTGTMLATELALQHPDLVRRIILMGIPYYDAEGRQERFERLCTAFATGHASSGHNRRLDVRLRDGLTDGCPQRRKPRLHAQELAARVEQRPSASISPLREVLRVLSGAIPQLSA